MTKAVEDMENDRKSKHKVASEFADSYKASMGKQVSVVLSGIDPESLVMVRTRCLLDWYNFSGVKFPYALFDYQRNLLKEGLFEAYNQWIFGPVSNQSAFKAWTGLHKTEYDAFLQYQRNHPLKLKNDEYYNDNKFSLAR